MVMTAASGSNLRCSLPPKVYAAGKNVEDNVLYVCFGSDHPALFCDKFYVRAPLHWIAGAADRPRPRTIWRGASAASSGLRTRGL